MSLPFEGTIVTGFAPQSCRAFLPAPQRRHVETAGREPRVPKPKTVGDMILEKKKSSPVVKCCVSHNTRQVLDVS